jgi:nitroreductase
VTKVETGIDAGAGLDMALANAMRTQRAIRRLRPDPVEDATILQLLELALKAPTSGNRQPVEFVVVRDPDVLHQLARLNRQAWAVYRRLGINRRRRNDERARRIVDAVKWQADHFEETPAVVVVCLRGRSPWGLPPFVAASYYGSGYPATQNLLLAARAVGLGATLATLPLWSTSLARRTLGLPRHVTPIAVVPLGWPAEPYGPTTRRPTGEVVHLDRYGNQPFR